MHVLVTTDTLNGLWAYTRELVTGLVGRRVRVTLVSFGEIPLPKEIAWMDRLHDFQYLPTAFRLDWMQEGQLDFADTSAYLSAVVKELKPNLIHSNHLAYGALAVAIPRIVVAHGDLITWWKTVRGQEPKLTPWLRWYRHTLERGIARATVVVAPSQWMLESVQSTYGCGARQLVIPHGRNPILFNPYISKDGSVLAIGRALDPAKQLHLLTGQDHPMPVCVLDEGEDSVVSRRSVGSDDRADAISEPAQTRQSESRLRLLYSRAAIFVGTSRYEPSGMTMLCAALSRCALLLNDIPSQREIWGEAAVYFRENDGESLAGNLRLLSENRELRKEYGNRAFFRARQCFNANRMVEQYLQLYHRVCVPQSRVA